MHPDEQEEFDAAWNAVDIQLRGRVKQVFEAPGSWRARMRAALAAILQFLADDPERANLYVAEAIFAGGSPRRGQLNAVEDLEAMIDSGRAEAGHRVLSPTLADAVAGSLWHCVRERVIAGRATELPGLLPELMYLVALPYLGSEAAAEELRREPDTRP